MSYWTWPLPKPHGSIRHSTPLPCSPRTPHAPRSKKVCLTAPLKVCRFCSKTSNARLAPTPQTMAPNFSQATHGPTIPPCSHALRLLVLCPSRAPHPPNWALVPSPKHKSMADQHATRGIWVAHQAALPAGRARLSPLELFPRRMALMAAALSASLPPPAALSE